MKLADLDSATLVDYTNHFCPGLDTVVFLTFLSPTHMKQFQSVLKRGYKWKPNDWNAEAFKLKFEDHITSTDRLLLQPFFAFIDYANDCLVDFASGNNYRVSADRRDLQVFMVQEDGFDKQLAGQLCFVPSDTGYRAVLMINPKLSGSYDLFMKHFRDRMNSTNFLIQAERASTHQGATRASSHFQLQLDASLTKGYSYPFELMVRQLDEQLIPSLMQDPNLLLRGKPTLLNAAAMAMLGVRKSPNRQLPPHLQDTDMKDADPPSSNKGKSKGKGKQKGKRRQDQPKKCFFSGNSLVQQAIRC
jgi:hypothetical protein